LFILSNTKKRTNIMYGQNTSSYFFCIKRDGKYSYQWDLNG